MKSLISPVLVLTVICLQANTPSTIAQSTWTSVNDGTQNNNIVLSPGDSSLQNHILTEDTNWQAVSKIRITPSTSDFNNAKLLLQIAANKVIVNGSWVPNNMDFIPKSDISYMHCNDYEDNPFFVSSPSPLSNDDWELVVTHSGMFNEEGIGYYDKRFNLYKKIITRMVYYVDENQFQNFITKNNQVLQQIDSILKVGGFAGKAEENIQKAITGSAPNWGGVKPGDIVKPLSTVINICQIIGAVDHQQQMMGIIAMGTTLETKYKLECLKSAIHATTSGNYYDPALIAAVDDIYNNFNQYWYGSDANGDWQQYLNQIIQDGGNRDWNTIAGIAASSSIQIIFTIAGMPQAYICILPCSTVISSRCLIPRYKQAFSFNSVMLSIVISSTMSRSFL